mmetsp:Transcript_13762/g.28236  ORF Transcript_13762/g.28236 Transcript_13762/m.28236 type:complete len:212 (-) Transcript_13762:461-1096(-)
MGDQLSFEADSESSTTMAPPGLDLDPVDKAHNSWDLAGVTLDLCDSRHPAQRSSLHVDHDRQFLDGEHVVDMFVESFSDRTVVIVSERGRIGSVMEVELEMADAPSSRRMWVSRSNGDDGGDHATYAVKTLLGVRDDQMILEVMARTLMERKVQRGDVSPLLFLFGTHRPLTMDLARALVDDISSRIQTFSLAPDISSGLQNMSLASHGSS